MHGFQNNADNTKDEKGETEIERMQRLNAVKFDYFMARLVDQVRRLHEQRHLKSPHAVGIYIGWRGKLIEGDSFGNLAIGNRASAADTIGQSYAKTGYRESLKSISDAVAKSKGKLLVVGHSLGGRATWKSFADDVARTGTTSLAGESLVALLEPAIGADCFKQAFKSPASSPRRKPAILSLTSRDDEALSVYYQLAARIPTYLGGIPAYEMSELSDHVIGGYEPYLTHELSFEHISVLSNIALENWHDPDGKRSLAYPEAKAHNQWFDVTSNKPRSIAYTTRPASCPATSCSKNYASNADIYSMTFDCYRCLASSASPLARPPAYGSFWNIVTDRNTVDSTTRASKKTSRLHTFISVNVARLFAELLYAE